MHPNAPHSAEKARNRGDDTSKFESNFRLRSNGPGSTVFGGYPIGFDDEEEQGDNLAEIGKLRCVCVQGKRVFVVLVVCLYIYLKNIPTYTQHIWGSYVATLVHVILGYIKQICLLK